MAQGLSNAVLTPAGFRRWRRHLGLSQAQAAELLGVVQRTVSGWEMGECRIPRTVVYAIQWLSDKDQAHERPED